MDPLQKHLDRLFAKVKLDQQTKELKEEMLSNLRAKTADMEAQGLSYEEAAANAIRDLDSIDHLIDGNRHIYKYRFLLEWLQTIILYTTIAWIVIIPMGIVSRTATYLSFAIPIAILLLGILNLVLYALFRSRREETSWIYLGQDRKKKISRTVWLVWTLFIIVLTLSTTAIHFGSNIWFQRPIHLSGPYQYAVLATEYLLPLTSIAIPLLVDRAFRLLSKHEAGEAYDS